MSQTKFTKGEWAANFPHVESKGRLISDCGISNYEDHEEEKANANLIAAAPDMYQMIEDLSFELQCAIDSINYDRMNKVTPQTETPPELWDSESLHDAQLLLKKARGES
ncbi:MAG: hypothetical protein JKY81_05725 [Colwellia sp.]|nr:hypothetical protein [Colwellia sp.]